MANEVSQKLLRGYGIFPSPGRGMSIKDRIMILDTTLELYKGAIDKCNITDISNMALKIGTHSATIRTELGTATGEESLKSLTDISLIEKGFMEQQNRLVSGRCKYRKWIPYL